MSFFHLASARARWCAALSLTAALPISCGGGDTEETTHAETTSIAVRPPLQLTAPLGFTVFDRTLVYEANVMNVMDLSDDGNVIVARRPAALGGNEGFKLWFRRDASGAMHVDDFSLPMPAGYFSGAAVGVSRDGQTIVGTAWNPSSNGPSLPLRWVGPPGASATAPVALGLLPGSVGWNVSGVSSDGAVVVGSANFHFSGPVRWTAPGGATLLGELAPGGETGELVYDAYDASADGSVVVGQSRGRPFRWDAQGGTQPLLADSTGGAAYAVSGDGETIVGSVTNGETQRPFRWTRSAGLLDLGLLSGTSVCGATSVSADGNVIVGDCYFEQEHRHRPFLWTPRRGIRPLADALAAAGIDFSAYDLTSMPHVSSDGSVIAGYAHRRSDNRIVIFRAVLPRVRFFSPSPSMNTASAVSADGSIMVGQMGGAASGTPARKVEGGEVESLGMLPDWRAGEALGASRDGSVVVGYGRTTSGSSHAFRWTALGLVDLGSVGDASSVDARAVSGDGAVVVGTSIHPNSRTKGYRWTESGGMIPIGPLAGDVSSTANSVSANGEVVVGVAGSTAYRWMPDGLTSLGSLQAGMRSEATAVSGDGEVVYGIAATTGGATHMFRWTSATGLKSLGTLAQGRISMPLHASEDGSVAVGVARNLVTGDSDAFRFRQRDGLRTMKSLLESAGIVLPAGWVLYGARGVSPDGQSIVGWGTDGTDIRAWKIDFEAP